MKKKLIAVLILLALPITVYSAEIGIGGLIFAGKTDSPATCNAALEGGLYYDDSEDALKVCDGSSWGAIGGGGGYSEHHYFSVSRLSWAGDGSTSKYAGMGPQFYYATDTMNGNVCSDGQGYNLLTWQFAADATLDKCAVALNDDGSGGVLDGTNVSVTLEFVEVTYGADGSPLDCAEASITNGSVTVGSMMSFGSSSGPSLSYEFDFSDPAFTARKQYALSVTIDPDGASAKQAHTGITCKFDFSG